MRILKRTDMLFFRERGLRSVGWNGNCSVAGVWKMRHSQKRVVG